MVVERVAVDNDVPGETSPTPPGLPRTRGADISGVTCGLSGCVSARWGRTRPGVGCSVSAPVSGGVSGRCPPGCGRTCPGSCPPLVSGVISPSVMA